MADMHLLFSSWGAKIAEGLSGEQGWDKSSVLNAIGGSRGTKRETVIPFRELTPDEQRIQRGFNKLGRGLRRALAMKYVISLLVERQDGRYWTNREMAKALGLSRPAFVDRLTRGKRAVRQSEFNFN